MRLFLWRHKVALLVVVVIVGGLAGIGAATKGARSGAYVCKPVSHGRAVAVYRLHQRDWTPAQLFAATNNCTRARWAYS